MASKLHIWQVNHANISNINVFRYLYMENNSIVARVSFVSTGSITNESPAVVLIARWQGSHPLSPCRLRIKQVPHAHNQSCKEEQQLAQSRQ